MLTSLALVPAGHEDHDLVMGVRDRGEHNLAGIRTTLANVKSTAESVSA
jgi:hypothetical protein